MTNPEHNQKQIHVPTKSNLNRQEIEQWRLKRFPSRWRSWLLRLALGRDTFEYMLRSIKFDWRTPKAKTIDIVIRQDGVEERLEADWVRTIARYTYHLPIPEHRMTPKWKLSMNLKIWSFKTWLRERIHGKSTDHLPMAMTEGSDQPTDIKELP